MLLFQFEKREAYFVIASFNIDSTPDGKWRFCQGLQFNSREDARKYVESVSDIERARDAQLRKTDSISGRWTVEDETKKRLDRLEKDNAGKCRRVIFDIPFVKGQVNKDMVYTTKEVKRIEYHDGIGAKNGKLPPRIA